VDAEERITLVRLKSRFSFVARAEARTMTNVRAVRYRRLALAEQDKQKADLLLKLAEEADQGILCIAQWKFAKSNRASRDELVKA
jgi:hypothetical protein